MNINQQTAIKESKMKITASTLFRLAGLSTMGAGIIYIAIQAIHPLDVFSSVTTDQWAVVHYLSIVMDFLALFGIMGLYAKQVNKVGWFGLVGYLLFSLFWTFSLAFHFVEAFVSPMLATVAPKFVEGLLGMVNGVPSEINLGAFSSVYMLTGIAGYVLGGLLFGITTFRAGVLPRWAGGLLALGTILPLLGSALVPHPFNRIFAVPVGLALVWLGSALWSERQAQASETAPSKGSPQRLQTTAK